jgi:hypothetical protein
MIGIGANMRLAIKNNMGITVRKETMMIIAAMNTMTTASIVDIEAEINSV